MGGEEEVLVDEISALEKVYIVDESAFILVEFLVYWALDVVFGKICYAPIWIVFEVLYCCFVGDSGFETGVVFLFTGGRGGWLIWERNLYKVWENYEGK